jgi:hypothetical protein
MRKALMIGLVGAMLRGGRGSSRDNDGHPTAARGDFLGEHTAGHRPVRRRTDRRRCRSWRTSHRNRLAECWRTPVLEGPRQHGNRTARGGR